MCPPRWSAVSPNLDHLSHPDHQQGRARLDEYALTADRQPSRVQALDEVLKDNAGKAIPTRELVRTDDVAAATTVALLDGAAVLLIGARTSATSCFDREYRSRPGLPAVTRTVGILPLGQTADHAGDVHYRLTHGQVHTQELPRSDEIWLHCHAEGPGLHTVRIGAGVTFAQVGRALRQAFATDTANDWCVPMDLTTVDVAQAGAVYATGAQGPSRFRLSDLARTVWLHTGSGVLALRTQADIALHEGLWGMTGAVVALELRVFARPKVRFGFFIPLVRSASGSWIEQASAVLALLREATTLSLHAGRLSSQWPGGLLDGAEVVARETLELVANTALPTGTNRIAAQKILGLMQEKERGGLVRHRSDFGIYLTGNAGHQDVDGFLADEASPLAKLLRYAEGQEAFLHEGGMMTIIGEERDLEEMRLLRESFADISRQHAKHRLPGQCPPFSESTDINGYIDPEVAAKLDLDGLRRKFRSILAPYYAYEMRIRDLAVVAQEHDVTITMTRYGHLNPRSTNLHTRVTVHAPASSIHAQVFQQVIQRARDNLMELLKELSQQDGDIRVEGGEKGKVTQEAWLLMTPAQRDQVAEALARALPQFQPHLKGKWAEPVSAVRAGLGPQQVAP